MYGTTLALAFIGGTVILFAVLRLSRKIDQIAEKLNIFEDWKHDDLIDEQLSREIEFYQKRRDQLQTETRGYYEVELGDEKLRKLIVEACGSPSDCYVDQDAQKISIDSVLAHSSQRLWLPHQ
jgi:hypothetical protein